MKKMLALLAVLILLGFGNALAIPTLGGEAPDLQVVLDDLTVDPSTGTDPGDTFDSSIDVTSNYLADTSDSTWSVSGSGTSVATMIIEVAGWANVNSFGVYNGSDEVTLFDGAAGAGEKVFLSIEDDFSVVISNSVVGFDYDTGIDFSSDSFGFFITNSPGDTFYSNTALNDDGVDHMLAYQGNNIDTIKLPGLAAGTWTDNEWLLAFEDTFGGGDDDYQDLVLMIESVEPIPEPGTLLLLGSGLIGLAYLKRRKA